MRFFSKPKIGLALSSGGTNSFSHIGVIQKLLEYNIEISCIAGSSGGAIAGAFYAKNKDINDFYRAYNKFTIKDLVKAFSDPQLFTGLFKGRKVVEYLRTIFGDTQIQDLKIPMRITSVNLLTGAKKIFTHGSLVEALRASVSLPVIFQPVQYKDKFLIDGGTGEPVPVHQVKKMGAEKIIAVNLNAFLKKKEIIPENLSKASILMSTMSIQLHHLALENCRFADIVITPQIESGPLITLKSLEDIKEKIKIGAAAVEEHRDEIHRLNRNRIVII